MTESFATSDGRTLAYEQVRSGPVLVCHPGGPGCSGRYFGDLGGLDRSLTLVRLDPRGAGRSDPPADGSYLLEQYASDLEELRRHLGLARIDLLGHSHGGFVAMVYAAAYPASLDLLVLVATLPRFSDEQRTEAAAILAEKAELPEFLAAAEARRERDGKGQPTDSELRDLFEREQPLYYVRNGSRTQEHVALVTHDPLQTDALRFFNREIAPTFDLRPRLASIEAPALVIAAEQDYVARPLAAREIASGIASSRLLVVPDAGHYPWIEQPDVVRDQIAAFLGQ